MSCGLTTELRGLSAAMSIFSSISIFPCLIQKLLLRCCFSCFFGIPPPGARYTHTNRMFESKQRPPLRCCCFSLAFSSAYLPALLFGYTKKGRVVALDLCLFFCGFVPRAGVSLVIPNPGHLRCGPSLPRRTPLALRHLSVHFEQKQPVLGNPHSRPRFLRHSLWTSH